MTTFVGLYDELARRLTVACNTVTITVEQRWSLRASPPPNDRKPVMVNMTHWIKTAYRFGDDTYRGFTAGRSLYPANVRYDADTPDEDGSG